MRHGRAKQLVFGSAGGIAGTVYGTIVVMATVTAGAKGERRTRDGSPWWSPSPCSFSGWHTCTRMGSRRVWSVAGGSTPAELRSVARREVSIIAAAVAPLAALVLAAVGVLDETTAVWLALGIGVLTLGVQGRRYATVEQLDRSGTLTAIAVNLFLGLVIVALEALLTH